MTEKQGNCDYPRPGLPEMAEPWWRRWGPADIRSGCREPAGSCVCFFAAAVRIVVARDTTVRGYGRLDGTGVTARLVVYVYGVCTIDVTRGVGFAPL